MKKAIIVMAKVPEAGRVKTRLQPFLTHEQSAEISVAFLQDAENKANKATENLFIAVSPFDKKNRLENILHHKPILIEQIGETLGEKMLHAFKIVFEKKIDSVVMFGTDSPTFPSDFIKQAFEFLELETDVVLGKTEDGGFYLIGLRKLDESIFKNVAWSSAETFEQVYQNVMNLNLHLREVPSWYDIDEKDDLIRLQNELKQSENARRRAAKTSAWLKKQQTFWN